ncbi:MrpF/PhaF family protein [Pseudoalteromonas sp. OOF1S-7]|uniref:monovalent cation/H+ antiporter complex subunit F n=1 Tax=Pseudoalteromonas sp. OOF1S-7 TaxID=2917757 RepID=UPI001EF60288|nr:MrpF/PhaF family protein [Pseudoalteromonas sp. OOF1S-7]MCG7535096.1 monovalent cation/H+ antiporter complex subunit F [Pseudoalteromonas sp. OOF1S-7]
MSDYLNLAISILTLALLGGLWRLWLGPSKLNRILSLQLFGTIGVAILALLAVVYQQSALFNVALVLALLAPTATVILVKMGEAKS